MRPPRTLRTQNQLASPAMGERNAIELQPAPFETIDAAQASGSRLTVIAVIVAGSLVAVALIVSGLGKLLLVTAMAALAAVGLFFLFAFVAGYVRFGQRQPLAEIVTAAADALDSGLMIASRDGEGLYANAAFAAMVGRREVEGVSTLQDLFTGEPQASAALFRLTRAAERGDNLGAITAALLRLLDRYGAAELEVSIIDALQRDVPHPNAVRLALERRREQRQEAPPVAIDLPAHVKTRDAPVQPHRLDAYDQLKDQTNE